MGARKRRDRRAPAQPRQAARGGSRGDREPARRPVRDPAVILRLLAIAGVAAAFTAPAHAGTSLVRGNDGAWLAYGHDDQLSSAVVSRILDSRTVARLAQRWNAGLDGLVAASPLYAEPLVDGVRMGVVYVATEAGSVYALAAADGRILWQQPGATTALDFCGGFPLGVSSTGAIDRGRNVLYVVGSDGLLNAYDLTTGAEAEGYPLQVVASPADQYVWGGLRIVASTLYVPVSSFCDQLDASGLFPDGGIVAVDLTDPSSQRVFDAVPGGGDGMIRLTLQLEVVDSDYPPGTDPRGDQDWGSAPVLSQPHGCPPLAAANSKNGVLYLWNRMSLAAGAIGGLGIGDARSPFVGQPSWSARLQMLFEAEASSPSGTGVAGIKFSYSGCGFGELWRTAIGGGNQAPPPVVNDVVFSGGGTEGIYALDGRTGKVIWSAATGGELTIAPLVEARGILFAPAGPGLRALSPPYCTGAAGRPAGLSLAPPGPAP